MDCARRCAPDTRRVFRYPPCIRAAACSFCFREQRLELRPHVVEKLRLRFDRRMHAIGLEEFTSLAKAFEKEGHQSDLVLRCHGLEESVELAYVSATVIRRDLHAHDQDA